MNESQDPSHIAKTKLEQAAKTKDKSVRLAWAITLCEAVLLSVFAIALIDYWLMLPVTLRSIAALMLAGLIGLGIYRLIRFFRRPTRLKEAALDVEATKPDLGCEISTAAEYLTGERKSTHEYEPELVAALEANAAKKLATSDVPYRKRLLRPALFLGFTCVALMIFLFAAPVAFTALQRVAFPFSKAHYTQLEVKPGHVEIPIGRDLDITNIFTGRLPKDARFHFAEAASGQWQSVALTASSNAPGLFIHSLKNVRADLKYRVTGSDAASDEFKIETYIPPAVKDLNLEIQHPEYTRLAPVRQKAPNIKAVRASMAGFDIEPNVELSKATLKFAALPEIPLERSPDGAWKGQVPITKDTEYWIELVDKKGHVGVNEKPFQITALPDKPPKVEILEPAQDTRAFSTNIVPVKISVSDDFGVGDITLVFHKLGGSEQTVAATRVSEENGEVLATADLDLNTLELREFELVAYHAEARDNNTLDGPGVGRSPMYFIEVTNLESGECLSQNKSQQVNLLVIQKQIIADTSALASKAAPEKFKELAARQRDATEFGRMYLDNLSAGGLEGEAITEMEAAVTDMEKAAEHLEKQARNEALPPEESALAHMYQVLKLLPELENLPTQPNPNRERPPSDRLRVVLDAIKQKKKQPEENKEIEEALELARELARSQSGVNTALAERAQETPADNSEKQPSQNQSQNPDGNQPGSPSGQGQGQGQSQRQAQNQNADQKDQRQSENQAGNPNQEQAGQQNKEGQSESLAQNRNRNQGQGQGSGQGEAEGQEEAQGQ
ncbi:MAG: DUF4175 family protein, partial [Verrucomicrobiota bacterium]